SAPDLRLELRNSFLHNLALAIQRRAATFKLVNLTSPHILDAWIINSGLKIRRQAQLCPTTIFSSQPLLGGPENEKLLGQDFEFCARLGVIEDDQGVAGFHTVAFLDPQFLDDAAVQMLQTFAVAFD